MKWTDLTACISRHMKHFLRIEIGVTGLFICMGLHLINTHHLSFIMLLRCLYSQVPNNNNNNNMTLFNEGNIIYLIK